MFQHHIYRHMLVFFLGLESLRSRLPCTSAFLPSYDAHETKRNAFLPTGITPKIRHSTSLSTAVSLAAGKRLRPKVPKSTDRCLAHFGCRAVPYQGAPLLPLVPFWRNPGVTFRATTTDHPTWSTPTGRGKRSRACFLHPALVRYSTVQPLQP